MIKKRFLKFIYYAGIWFRNIFSRIYFNTLKHHCRGDVLDVGGGNFYEFFKKIVASYASYTNLESQEGLILDVYPIQHKDYQADEVHHIVYGDGTKMPFRDHSFDTAINSQVLEHIFNPIVMIEEIYRVLKPGGKGVFLISQTTPMHGIPFHYGNLSLYGAREAFKKTGFQIIEEIYPGGLWRTILYRHLFFFLQLLRVPGYSSADFKRNTLYYFLAPIMVIYAFINLPILLLFSLADHKEDANNLVFVVKK